MNDAPHPDNGETPEKDVPLRYDTRLLGRILGDTVRSQEGEQVFDLVERIRRTGVQFHRNADEERAARAAVDHERPADRRGDPHHPRLRLFLAPRQPRRGPAPHPAHARLRHGRGAAAARHHGLRAGPRAAMPASRASSSRASSPARSASPVLTAHPTEVRRQSTIDREREIARLLDERDRVRFTPEELNDNRRALRRNVLTLWQTSLIRHSRLRVLDEVANALAYYDHTFLAALPEFYADLEDQLGFDVPSFLRMGSWIGGDRDGNPNVTAEVTRETLAMQSQHALRHHLEELHLLGAELPLYGPMVHVSDALQALADRSPDTADERKDEPYRRALTGMYARLAATAWSLDKLEPPHPPVGPAPRLRDGGRIQGRSRYDPRLARRQQSRSPRARPAARAAARGRRVRLPSRRARHPPEFRRARAGHGRAGRGGRGGQGLCGNGRGRARGPADRRISPIRVPWPRRTMPTARRPPASSTCCGSPPMPIAATARRRCRTT